MVDWLTRQLRDLAEQQRGLLTAQQLAEAGISRSAVTSRLRQGDWQRPRRGVYASFSGEMGRPGQLWAAVLYAGPGAALSYWTAAEVNGLRDRESGLIHVTVPWDRRVQPATGLALHRSRRALDALHPSRQPPQTRVEETALDLAGLAETLDDAVSWVTRALQRRLTTPDKLRLALAARPRIRWRRQLAELLTTDAAGLHSILEVRYHRDVELPHGLPAGSRQVRFRLGDHNEYRDLLYAEFATAVELDGVAAHPADSRWRDIERDNSAAAGGVVTLRYGWLDLTTRPCAVAAQVALVLGSRGFDGGHACSPACAVAGMLAERPARDISKRPGQRPVSIGTARKAPATADQPGRPVSRRPTRQSACSAPASQRPASGITGQHTRQSAGSAPASQRTATGVSGSRAGTPNGPASSPPAPGRPRSQPSAARPPRRSQATR
jgi:Transcriptional regulator, AbiEi antitoxin